MEEIKLAIIRERYKYRTITWVPSFYEGRTFEISEELSERYMKALREIQTVESEIIHEAREQKAYPPMQEKPERHRVEEGQIIKF